MERKWCAIDAEGDVGDKGLLGVAFYTDRGGQYVTHIPVIRDVLLEYARDGYTFIAHNAEYDLSVIFWQLDIPMRAVYYNGRFNRGEWSYAANRTAAQLWDTLRLSGGLSLASLGAALGVEKLPTPAALLGKVPDPHSWRCTEHNSLECETCYAVRDAEICWLFMTGLTTALAAWGVDPKRTLSGIAEKVWRELDQPKPIGLDNGRIRRLARAAYHGGRTEVFQYGHIAPLYTADVQSMYPAVMLSTPFPHPDYMIHGYNWQVEEIPWGKQGVAEVDITVPHMRVPPLPHVVKGQLSYPVGSMRGSWTLLELEYALTQGCTINRVYQMAYSTESIRPFTSFILTLWRMREEYKASRDPRQLFAKLLMNNLYGRMGMKVKLERQTIWKAEPGATLSARKYDAWYTEDADLFLSHTRCEPHSLDWTNVLWAAQITAAARIFLHTYMLLQGQSLVYCDTDSIFSNAPIVGVSDGLGMLARDGEYISSIIAGPKLYAVQDSAGDWTGKARGVSRRLALDFIRSGHVVDRQPVKPRSQGKRGILAGTWIDRPVEAQNRPPRRYLDDAAALTSEFGWTGTKPPWTGRW